MIFFPVFGPLMRHSPPPSDKDYYFNFGQQRGCVWSIWRYLVNTWPMPHISHLWRSFTKRPGVISSCVRILSLKSTKNHLAIGYQFLVWRPSLREYLIETVSKNFISLNCSNLQHCVQGSLRRKERSNGQIRPKLPNPTLGYMAINSQSLLNARSLFQCSFPCIRTHKFKFIQILPFTSYLSCLSEKHLAVL